jgi:hypothetical protein
MDGDGVQIGLAVNVQVAALGQCAAPTQELDTTRERLQRDFKRLSACSGAWAAGFQARYCGPRPSMALPCPTASRLHRTQQRNACSIFLMG